MNKYLISIILILLLSTTILTKHNDKDGKLKKHKKHHHNHNLLQNDFTDGDDSDIDVIQTVNTVEGQNNKYKDEPLVEEEEEGEGEEFDVSISPHIEAITPTPDQNDELFAANYNFEDYYTEIKSIVDADLAEVQTKLAEVSGQCIEYEGQIEYFEGQIVYYTNYNTYLEGKIEENLARIENIYDERCEAHSIFIEYAKNARITVRLLNFLEEAIENYSFAQLRSMNRVLNQYMSAPVVSNNESLKAFIQALQNVDEEQYEVEEREDLDLRTEEQIADKHTDTSVYGEFELEDQELRGNTYLDGYKEQLKEIIAELRTNMENSLSLRQDSEIELNGKTSEFVYKMETDNAFMRLQIERNEETLDRLNAELQATKYLLAVCKVDEEWLINVEASQQTIVESVYSSEAVLREQYDIFWSVRPDLWQLGSGKVFDLYNYDGFGLKVPQPGLQNFIINFDFGNCSYCSAGAVVTDVNYQTLYSVGANVAQSPDSALQYSQTDVETFLEIQFSSSQEGAAKIYIFVTVEGEYTFEEVFQNSFSMVIQGEEFAQFKTNPSQLQGATASTFFFAFEFYQHLSIVNGNEEQKEWHVVPTLKFSEGTPKSPTQAGVNSTIQSFSSEPAHGSGQETFAWNADFDRPVNIRNYAYSGIKVPQSGLNEIIVGLDFDGDYDVNAGFVAVDQKYEITSVVSVGTSTEDYNNQLFLKTLTTQFTGDEDKLQLSAGLSSVISSNDAVFVILSITGSTFNDIEKQRVSLYIGGKLFAFLIQYPSQNLDCYGTSSYLALKFYRNSEDDMSWYVQYVDQWVDLNIDGSAAQATNSEGVRRAIRNLYWDVHYTGFGQGFYIPTWGKESVQIQLSSESSWLDFGVVVLDLDTDEVVSVVSKNNDTDGVFTLSQNRSISFNLNDIPETYKENTFVVHIENESYFFNSEAKFSFKVIVAGTRIAEFTVAGSEEKDDLVFYKAFALSNDGIVSFRNTVYANCPRSLDATPEALFQAITGRKITGSAKLRSSVNAEIVDQFQIPSGAPLALGVHWPESVDVDIILYVIKGKEVDNAPFVNYGTSSYETTVITFSYSTIESKEAWAIDLPNLGEDVTQLICTAAIYSSYQYDSISELTFNFYSEGKFYTKYTIQPGQQTDTSSKTAFIFGDLYRQDGQWYYKKLDRWIGQDANGNWARYSSSQNLKDAIRGYLGFDIINIEEIKIGQVQLPAFVSEKVITFEYDWTPDYNLDVVCYVLRDGNIQNAPYVDSSNHSFNGGQITWDSSDEDSDERFIINFDKLESNVTHLLIAVSIVDADVFFDSIESIDIQFKFAEATFASYILKPSEYEGVDQFTSVVLGELFLRGDLWFYERYDRFVATDYNGNVARGNDKTLRNIVTRFKQVVDIDKQEKFEVSTEVTQQIVGIEFDWEPETDLDIILYIVKDGNVSEAPYVNYANTSYNNGVASWGSSSGEVDESFNINFSQLEENVDQLIVVVCVYDTNFFDFIETIEITFTAAEIPFATTLIYPSQSEGSSDSTALVLGQFTRFKGGWEYERLNYYIVGTDTNGEYPRTANFNYIRQQAGLITRKTNLNNVQNFQLPAECQDGTISLSYDWSPEANLDINLYVIRNGEVDQAPIVNETVKNFNTDQVVWGGADNEGNFTYDEQFQIDFSTLDADVQHLVVVISIADTNFFDYIDEITVTYKWNGATFATAVFDPQSLENSDVSTSILLGEFQLEYGVWWYYRYNTYIVGTDSEGNYPRTFESQYIRNTIKEKLGYTVTEISPGTTNYELPLQAYDSLVAFNFDWQPNIDLDIIMFVITSENTLETASYLNYSVRSYNEGQITFDDSSEQYDENFVVDFGNLDENVQQMIIVVCVYSSSYYDTIESSRFYLSYNGFTFADETIYPSQMSGAGDSTALVLGECKKEGAFWYYYRWNRLIIGADSEGNYPRTVDSVYLRQMILLQLQTTSINQSQSYELPSYVQNQTVKVKYDWTPDLDLDILMYIIENKEVGAAPYVNQQNQDYNDGVITWGGSDDHSDEKFAINFGALDPSVDHLITSILVQGESYFDSIEELHIEYTFNGIAFASQSIYPNQVESAGSYTALVLGEYVRDESGNWVYYRWNRYFDTIRDDSSSIIRDYIIQYFGYYKYIINDLDNFELPDDCYNYIVSINYDWQPQISVDIIMYIIQGSDVDGAQIVDYQNTSYSSNYIQWKAQGANDQDEFYVDFTQLGDVQHLVVVMCLWENFFSEMTSIQVYFNYDSYAFGEEFIQPSQWEGASQSTALVLGQFQNHSGRWYYYKYNKLITGTDSNGMYPRSGSSVYIRQFLGIILGYNVESITTSEWRVPTDLVGGLVSVQYDWSPDINIDILLYVITNQDAYAAPFVGVGANIYNNGNGDMITYGQDSYDKELFDINFAGLSGSERLCLVIQIRDTSLYFNSVSSMDVQFMFGGIVFATTSFSPSSLNDSQRSGALFVGEFRVNGGYWYYYSYNEPIVANDSSNRSGDAQTIRQYIAQSLGWEAQDINSDGGFNFSHTATGNKITVKYDWEPIVDMDIGVYIVTDNNDIQNAPYINYSNRQYDQGQIYYGDDSSTAEQFDIELDRLQSNVTRLVIVICMYSSSYWMNYITSLETTFSYNGQVIAESMKYPNQLPSSDQTTSIIMGEIKRTSSGWRYYEYYTPIYGTNSGGSWPRHISKQQVKDAIQNLPQW